ncbi:MAG: hypothetical protein KAS72_06575 [Phycisphaerales bacterium]|nr:hypothetical protein [Phycisphaerales bacterium]
MDERIDNEAELLAWIEGELSAEDAARVEARLSLDPALAGVLHAMRDDRDALCDLGDADLPEDLAEDVQHILERSMLLGGDAAEGVLAGPDVFTQRRPSWGRWLAAAAAVVLVVTAAVVYRSTLSQPHPATPGSSEFAKGEAEETLLGESDVTMRTRTPSARGDDLGAARTAPTEVAGEAIVPGGDVAAVPDEHLTFRSVDPLAAAAEATTDEAPGTPIAEGGSTVVADALDETEPPGAILSEVWDLDEPSVFADRLVEAEIARADEEIAPTLTVWVNDTPQQVTLLALNDETLRRQVVLTISTDDMQYTNARFAEVARMLGRGQTHEETTRGAAIVPSEERSADKAARAPARRVTRSKMMGDHDAEAEQQDQAEQPTTAETEQSAPPTLRRAGGEENDQTAIEEKTDAAERRREVVTPDDADDDHAAALARIEFLAPISESEFAALRIPLDQLHEFVELLNTDTQVARLELDVDDRAQFTTARLHLTQGDSILWWRQRPWLDARAATLRIVERSADDDAVADDAPMR